MKYDTSWLLGLVVNLSIAADLSLWPGSGKVYPQVLGLNALMPTPSPAALPSKRTARFSPPLAHRKTGISRSGRRDVCRSGAWLAQLRVSRVDPRRRLLADRNGRRRCSTLRCLCRQFLSRSRQL